MDSNKNVLENWVEAQTKAVNNVVETSRKVQESFLKGNLLEETTDIYKNWLQNQQSIVEETMNGSKEQPSATTANAGSNNQQATAAADMFNTWMNAQVQFAKNWMESFSKMSAPAMPDMNNMFAPMNMLNETAKLYQQWNGLYSNVLNATNGQLGAFKNMMPGMNDMSSSFSQMLNSNQVFVKLFEMWQPMMQQLQKNMNGMQQNGNKMTDLLKAYSPEKYREVMDTVFNFAGADSFKKLYEQFNTYAHQVQAQNHELQQKWMQQVQQIGNAFPESTTAMSSAMLNNPMVKHMEQAFAPLTRLMPGGKEKDTLEAWMQLKDKFAEYWNKYNELQYIIYTTGQRAMERVLENSMQKMREANGQPVDFKEFYNQWMNTTEQMMIETFGGDEFSRAQGEVLTVGAEIKRVLEKQMERYMEGLPVVPRTEADEMAQSIHDLKARVRSLEKELRKARETNAEADEKTTKKATAKK